MPAVIQQLHSLLSASPKGQAACGIAVNEQHKPRKRETFTSTGAVGAGNFHKSLRRATELGEALHGSPLRIKFLDRSDRAHYSLWAVLKQSSTGSLVLVWVVGR